MKPILTLTFLLLTSNAYAQSVGDTVFVISKTYTELKSGTTVVGKVPPAMNLTIKKINEDWFWVVSGGQKGWIKKNKVALPSKAIEIFTQYIQEESTSRVKAYWYSIRALIWQHKGELDEAIMDYTEAIRLAPNQSDVYHIISLTNRGSVWKKKQEYDKAIQDYNEAIRLGPKNADAHNSRAWLYATCPNADYCNGEKAVNDATQACELTNWKNSSFIDTLSAAYAEKGDFENAIKWIRKAISMDDDYKDIRKKMLKLFESGKPYRV